jgi:hypothetical protein
MVMNDPRCTLMTKTLPALKSQVKCKRRVLYLAYTDRLRLERLEPIYSRIPTTQIGCPNDGSSFRWELFSLTMPKSNANRAMETQNAARSIYVHARRLPQYRIWPWQWPYVNLS